MKIDPTLRPVTGGTVQNDHARPARSSSHQTGGTSGESVNLSPLSARLHAIETGLSDREVVDAARVAEIKQAIAEGRFRVNAEAVAERLVETVRELIRSHKA